jgi:hypothetical protein
LLGTEQRTFVAKSGDYGLGPFEQVIFAQSSSLNCSPDKTEICWPGSKI